MKAAITNKAYKQVKDLYQNTHELRSKLTVITLSIDESNYTEEEKSCLHKMCNLLSNKIKDLKHSEELFLKALKEIHKDESDDIMKVMSLV